MSDKIYKNEHAVSVEAWMEATAKGLTNAQLLQLFEKALGVLWQRAQWTLGDVTLVAIVDRVLHTTAERFPLLAALDVDASGFHCDELRERARDPAELARAMQFFLVEFLTVLGSLTAEILTPALHSELPGVTALPDGGPRGRSGRSPAKITRGEGESS